MTGHLIRSAILCAITAAGWGYAFRIILQDWRDRR